MAENVCTEKYVYLIEKEKHVPSTDILFAFSHKMNVDIFSFYPYLDCAAPVAMQEYFAQFDFYRRKMDYISLWELPQKNSNLADFQVSPWCYELVINQLSYELFINNNTKSVIEKATAVLQEADAKKIYCEPLSGIGVLLSSAFQMCGELENAKEVTFKAYQLVKDKKGQKSCKLWIKSVYLNLMTLAYYLGEYENAIAYGNELVYYQNEFDAYERAHFTYCYLAFNYSRLGKESEALQWFTKGLHFIMAQDRIIDTFYIRSFPEFDQLLHHKKMDSSFANYFETTAKHTD